MKVKYIGETDPVCMINGKIYECIGEECGEYRIIDEEGVDEEQEIQGYLYPKRFFEIAEHSWKERTDRMDKIIHGLDLPDEIDERNNEIIKKKFGITDEEINAFEIDEDEEDEWQFPIHLQNSSHTWVGYGQIKKYVLQCRSREYLFLFCCWQLVKL